jgi:hypothetical protein
MGLQEERDQQFVDRFARIDDLVVAFSGGRTSRRQLQPVQRAFAGQRFREIALSGQHPQQRILPQLLVIVQILIGQRQPIDPLPQHLFQTVLDPLPLSVIRKAASHASQQTYLAIRLTQQKRTALSTQPASLELSYDLARKMSFKREESLATLCH